MRIISISDIQKELIQPFDCGNEELNCYLKEFALQNANKNIAKTFVLENNNKIIGYYSLANAQIGFENLNENLKKRLPKYPIPAIRIARLAVSKFEQKKGYGALLLKDAFLRILVISKQSGICFIIVDAKEEAMTFYEKFGFIRLLGLSSTYLLPVKTIEKAYILAK